MTKNARDPARFSYHMIAKVREYGLAGLVTNSEIAGVLRAYFDERITERDVARWRGQHPKFERACILAIDEPNMVVANVLYEAAKDGDLPTARWWSERRNPAFMPKSKLEHSGQVTSLSDTLERRSKADQEEDARKRGLIYDEEDGE